jgi:probable F420-dependent oxidoreductase
MKFVAPLAMVDPLHHAPLARAAEEAGFDGVSVADSVAYPQVSDSKYPYTADGGREFLEDKPFLEPVVALTAIACATSRVELVPFVLKLPIRHPVLFAKQATSLAVLSGGRLRLGVGLSPWPDDYELVELPWKARGRRFEECLTVLKKLQTGDYAAHDGEFYRFPAIKMNPVPDRPIPLLLAGGSDAMVDRTGRLGDGWVTTGQSRDEIETMIGRIRKALAAHGRQDVPFDIHTTAAPDVDEIRRLEDIGVTHVHSAFVGRSPYETRRDASPLDRRIERLQRFGEEIISRLRG